MNIHHLNDVLKHELMDMHDAEKQVLEAMPTMMKAVHTDKLRNKFAKHREETEEQIKRLEEAVQALGVTANGHTCEGMKGLIKESQMLLKENPSPALDAALIASAQRIEHYEIAGYGTAITLAETLGEKKVADLLRKNMREEEKTDEMLSELAEAEVNQQAMTV